jgi:hypothetical protein
VVPPLNHFGEISRNSLWLFPRLVEKVSPWEIDNPPFPCEGWDFLAIPATCLRSQSLGNGRPPFPCEGRDFSTTPATC